MASTIVLIAVMILEVVAIVVAVIQVVLIAVAVIRSGGCDGGF